MIKNTSKRKNDRVAHDSRSKKKHSSQAQGAVVPAKKKTFSSPPAHLPPEIIRMILDHFVARNDVRSALLVCSLNRYWYSTVAGDYKLWLQFYNKRWCIGDLPNHRMKLTYPFLRQQNIKTPSDYRLARRHFKRIVTLQNTFSCTSCGQKCVAEYYNFYDLGVHFCSHCVRDRFISNRVLYEKYGIMLSSVVGGTRFVAMIQRRVYYFGDMYTMNARRQYTMNRLDLVGGVSRLFFFYEAHLKHVLDLPTLAASYPQRFSAAQVIKAAARRAALARIRRAIKDPREFVYRATVRHYDGKRARFPDYNAVVNNNGVQERLFNILVRYQETMPPLRDVIPCADLNFE